MIAQLKGTTLQAGATSCVVEVGGIGLLVHVTPGTAAGLRPGEEATLHTSLVVREDSLTLFGFADEDERQVFETLQTITGVGPRLAQSLLAVHRPDALRRAVADDDVAALMLVPGVGRKGAQRLVLELKDKLGADVTATVGVNRTPPASSDVLHALLALGYSDKEAVAAIKQLPEGVAVADGIRQALKLLAKA